MAAEDFIWRDAGRTVVFRGGAIAAAGTILGEKLSLPPAFEHLREQVEPNLRPITNPRTAAAAK